jgi:drug/metabolite transporter (DMT)-like permease
MGATCLRFEQLSGVLGIILGVVSALLFAIGVVFFKNVEGMDSNEIICMRALTATLPTAAFLLMKGETLILLNNIYVWIISVGLMFSTYAFFAALGSLSFGDANAIYYSSTVIVGVLGYVFLKEPFRRFDILVTFAMIFGIMLIVQPTFLKTLFHLNAQNVQNYNSSTMATAILCENDTVQIRHYNGTGDTSTGYVVTISRNRTNSTLTASFSDNEYKLPRIYACILVIAATVIEAITYILRKKIAEMNPITLTFQSNLVMVIGGLAIIPAIGVWPSFPAKPDPWLWIAAAALANLIGQVIWQLAMRYDTATAISIARTSETPVAYLIQIIFYHNIPNALSISGAVLVTASVLGFGLQRYWAKRETEDKTVEDEGKELLGEIENNQSDSEEE